MVSKINDNTICIIGLGYVGIPLLIEFSKYFKVIGFDIDKSRVKKLEEKYKNFKLTTDPSQIKFANIVIITVPTPVTKAKQPDLSYIKSAAKTVGKYLKKDTIIVLESTVYPGVTEEVVGPIIEKESGLKLGKDFTLGYSPERVNPGDKNHTIDKIVKIVSGMDKKTTEKLIEIYGKITKVFKAKDIKTAEAAKVIENAQRDLNIALFNELCIIFYKLGMDSKAVFDAAKTKWNFYPFMPGLVGGHCIPVDPYYLVYKAKETDYHPQVILAGRSVNDYMPKHVAELTIKALNDAGVVIKGSKILIMGLTFKENVEDTRETPVVAIIKELKDYKCNVFGYDPLLSKKQVESFKINAIDSLKNIKVDCVILTVMHDVFKKIKLEQIKRIMKKPPVLIDVRGKFRKAESNDFIYRSL